MEYLGNIGDNHQTKNRESPNVQLRGNIKEPIKENIRKNTNGVRLPVERQSKHLAPTTKEPKNRQYSLLGAIPTNIPKHTAHNLGRKRRLYYGSVFNYRGARHHALGTTHWSKTMDPSRAPPKQFNTRKMLIPNFDPSSGVGTSPTIGRRNARHGRFGGKK
jgi:hypothetical protein